MDALAAAHDAAVQMIETSIVRVQQYGACIANNSGQHIGRSRGGRMWSPLVASSRQPALDDAKAPAGEADHLRA
jgi:hypothetical protein